jgi:hypothetical protein
MASQRIKDIFLVFLIYGYWDKCYYCCCRILASMYLNQYNPLLIAIYTKKIRPHFFHVIILIQVESIL